MYVRGHIMYVGGDNIVYFRGVILWMLGGGHMLYVRGGHIMYVRG